MDDSQFFVEDLEELQFDTKVTDLPDEVLLNVFGYLSTHEVLKHIALVCKHFQRLSKDSSLIKEIYLKPLIDESSQEYIYEALGRSRCLHTLILKGKKFCKLEFEIPFVLKSLLIYNILYIHYWTEMIAHYIERLK